MAALVTIVQWCLDQAVDCLDDTTKLIVTDPAPTQRRIHWGEINSVFWDNCCDGRNGNVGGQITASVGRVTQGPRKDARSTQSSCGGGWEVPVTVQVLRCAPTPNKQGVVAWSDLENDAVIRFDEALAIACWFGDQFGKLPGYDGVVTAMSTLDEGGCRAVRVEMTVHLI